MNSNHPSTFAEFFESLDGNPISNGIPVVLLPNRKIRPALNNDIPFGVISEHCSVVSNSCDDEWHGKYDLDSCGKKIIVEYESFVDEPIEEEVEIIIQEHVREKDCFRQTSKRKMIKRKKTKEFPLLDECGTLIGTKSVIETKKVPIKCFEYKLSPQYDPTKKYIGRSSRPEWCKVGLLGVVIIKEGYSINSNWIKLDQTKCIEGFSYYFIK